MIYQGSCHCGAIRFEVEAPEVIEADDCNCSICTKSGALHLIVPSTAFALLAGEESMTTYRFNSGIAKHPFCKVCGIKPFHIPRSNPDGVDINLNCLDTRPKAINVTAFNGREWEKHAHKLAHKSQ